MLAEREQEVKISFVSGRSEGGGLEPQWLMGHSPVLQTVASTTGNALNTVVCLRSRYTTTRSGIVTLATN